MIRSTIVGLIVVVVIAKLVTGMLSISFASEQSQETITFPAPSTKQYAVHALNGRIDFSGNDPSKPTEIVAIRIGRGSNRERAKQALDAIEVTAEGKNAETCEIGWRWRRPKEIDWSGEVHFAVRAPRSSNIHAETVNGAITIKGLTGNLKAATTNGSIDTESSGEILDAQTVNGAVRARFTGKNINLQGCNGHLTADLTGCRGVEGSISTTNGGITVAVGEETACRLSASVINGKVRCEPHLADEKKRRRSISGTLGPKLDGGAGKLEISTHNGSIHIRDSAR